MTDGQSNSKLKKLLVQCKETLELTEEDKLWHATPGEEEARNFFEDAEVLRLALQAPGEGGPSKTSDQLQHDLGLGDTPQLDCEA